MSDPFIGEIMLFGGNFAPRGWAFCDGQLLAINSNSALFSLLGTIYGGDGRTTFALPDLRGRAPLHQGNGPGLGNRNIGQRGGAEQVTLNVTQIPSHTHALEGSSNEATTNAPGGGAVMADTNTALYSAGAPGSALSGLAVASNGGSQSHPNMMPYLAVNYCIALVGVFPSRN